jgi:hypothetical protein
MTLHDHIVKAFSNRVMPPRVSTYKPSSSEDNDLLWFNGKNWQEITFEDWRTHPEAFHFFKPDAFAYYLQSIICISLENPQKWFYPADSLLQVLDRSPVVEYWDDFILSRLRVLYPEEYAVLKEWVIWLTDYHQIYASIDFERVFDTLHLLENEAKSRAV